MYTGLWNTNHKRNIANTKLFSNLESCTVLIGQLDRLHLTWLLYYLTCRCPPPPVLTLRVIFHLLHWRSIYPKQYPHHLKQKQDKSKIYIQFIVWMRSWTDCCPFHWILESSTVLLANLIVCVWSHCYITWCAVALPRQCWPWRWFFIFFIDVHCIPNNTLTILSKNMIKVKYIYSLFFE